MKNCPFCAEEIQDDAVKCRHCNEFIEDVKIKKQKGPWYYNTVSLFIAFAIVGPFMLPLVWLNPRYSKNIKIIVTIIIGLFTIAATKMVLFSFGSIGQYMDLLQGKYPPSY